uniref:Uncharacterized protein n=1 Tax=Moniliophthora roreri TaxID=221103 RepID=A0A0W0FTA7_MONRR
MSTNVSASASTSSSSASNQTQGLPSSTPTEAGEGRYSENIIYHHGLHPNPYQLLHLFNSQQYDQQIRNAANLNNQLEPAVKSLFFLWAQCQLLSKIAESCDIEIANQVLYACNYRIGLEGLVTVPSTFPYHLHLSMPPSRSPSSF